jgi:hypothetical protein
MANKRSTNHHEGITQLAVHDALPVLIDAPEKVREGMIPQHGRFNDGHWNKPIRRMPESALSAFIQSRSRATFEKEFGVIRDKERARILYLLGLAGAIHARDIDSLSKAVASFHRTIGQDSFFKNRALSRPLIELGEQLNVCIRGAIFVIWWSDIQKRFLAGLYCKDLTTALGALALAKIGRPGGLSTCQRPQCGRVFIRSRSKQDYCSPQCQAAAAMTRYRAKLNKDGVIRKRQKSRRKR